EGGPIVAALAGVVEDLAQGRQCCTVGRMPADADVAIAGTQLPVGVGQVTPFDQSVAGAALRSARGRQARAEVRLAWTPELRGSRRVPVNRHVLPAGQRCDFFERWHEPRGGEIPDLVVGLAEIADDLVEAGATLEVELDLDRGPLWADEHPIW